MLDLGHRAEGGEPVPDLVDSTRKLHERTDSRATTRPSEVRIVSAQKQSVRALGIVWTTVNYIDAPAEIARIRSAMRGRSRSRHDRCRVGKVRRTRCVVLGGDLRRG